MLLLPKVQDLCINPFSIRFILVIICCLFKNFASLRNISFGKWPKILAFYVSCPLSPLWHYGFFLIWYLSIIQYYGYPFWISSICFWTRCSSLVCEFLWFILYLLFHYLQILLFWLWTDIVSLIFRRQSFQWIYPICTMSLFWLFYAGEADSTFFCYSDKGGLCFILETGVSVFVFSFFPFFVYACLHVCLFTYACFPSHNKIRDR